MVIRVLAISDALLGETASCDLKLSAAAALGDWLVVFIPQNGAICPGSDEAVCCAMEFGICQTLELPKAEKGVGVAIQSSQYYSVDNLHNLFG